MRTVNWFFAVSVALFVAGIGFVVTGARAARDVPARSGPDVAPIATVAQIMAGMVQPASETVFNAVSTSVTEKGVEEVMPRTDAEWAAVATGGALLAEAGNMMLLDGRAVDQGEWVAMSKALTVAAGDVLKAVSAKDPEGVLNSGSEVYVACDNCHMRYWRQ